MGRGGGGEGGRDLGPTQCPPPVPWDSRQHSRRPRPTLLSPDNTPGNLRSISAGPRHTSWDPDAVQAFPDTLQGTPDPPQEILGPSPGTTDPPQGTIENVPRGPRPTLQGSKPTLGSPDPYQRAHSPKGPQVHIGGSWAFLGEVWVHRRVSRAHPEDLFEPHSRRPRHTWVDMDRRNTLKDSEHGQESQAHPRRLPTCLIFPLFTHVTTDGIPGCRPSSPCERTF